MGPKSQYLLRFIHKISWNRKCMKRRLLIQQEFDPILHLLLAVQDTMWQKCIWELRYKAGVFFHKNWYVIFIFAYPFGKIDKTNFFLNDLGWLLRNKKLYSKIHMPNYIDFSSNRAILFKNEIIFSSQGWRSPKICIKYRKHWKSNVSFQLSGQIGLVWAVRNHPPNWRQLYHERPMTIFKVIFKKLPKSKKVWLLRFQTKKGMWVLVND